MNRKILFIGGFLVFVLLGLMLPFSSGGESYYEKEFNGGIIIRIYPDGDWESPASRVSYSIKAQGKEVVSDRFLTAVYESPIQTLIFTDYVDSQHDLINVNYKIGEQEGLLTYNKKFKTHYP